MDNAMLPYWQAVTLTALCSLSNLVPADPTEVVIKVENKSILEVKAKDSPDSSVPFSIMITRTTPEETAGFRNEENVVDLFAGEEDANVPRRAVAIERDNSTRCRACRNTQQQCKTFWSCFFSLVMMPVRSCTMEHSDALSADIPRDTLPEALNYFSENLRQHHIWIFQDSESSSLIITFSNGQVPLRLSVLNSRINSLQSLFETRTTVSNQNINEASVLSLFVSSELLNKIIDHMIKARQILTPERIFAYRLPTDSATRRVNYNEDCVTSSVNDNGNRVIQITVLSQNNTSDRIILELLSPIEVTLAPITDTENYPVYDLTQNATETQNLLELGAAAASNTVTVPHELEASAEF